MLAQSDDLSRHGPFRLGRRRMSWTAPGSRHIALGTRSGCSPAVWPTLPRRAPSGGGALLALPVDTVILDGKAIVLRSDARPPPFQETIRGLGPRRKPVGLLVPFFFDCLHLDGDDLLDLPLHRRSEALRLAVPEVLRVPGAVAGDLPAAQAVLDQALDLGHEG